MKLVYLHGSGLDQTAYADVVKKVADYFKAEVYTFDAPIKHEKKGFKWFNKVECNGRRDAVKEDFENSVKFIKDKIKGLDVPNEEIILFGHSQGGAMAVAVGLELKLNKVIAVCADMPYNLSYPKSGQTPIYWFECGKDGYINRERQKSYHLLPKARLKFQVLPNSQHLNFGEELLKQLPTCHDDFQLTKMLQRRTLSTNKF